MTREEIIRLASLVGTDSKDAEANLLQAISAAMKAAKPEKINYHDAIGDFVGHDDKDLESFDKGYNKGCNTYETNLDTFLGGGNG